MAANVPSILPTPPSSPSPSPRKLIAISTISAVSLPITVPSQPDKDVPALLQQESPPVSSSQSTTYTGLTPVSAGTSTINPPQIGGPPSRTLAAIKDDLQINTWRCGAQTLRNTQCKRSVIHDRKALIDAQLASMTSLTRASPNLESALVELIMLVHCHQHDAGQPKERRLEAWKLKFPPGSADGSVPKVPVDQLIRKVLEPFHVKCIVPDKKWACEHKLGGWKVQNYMRTIQELIKPESYSDNARFDFLLKVLEWNRTCDLHQISMQFTWVKAWKKGILTILPYPMTLSDRAATSNVPNEPKNPTEIELMPSPRASPSPTISVDSDPALYWPKAYDLKPFDILTHAKHDASRQHLHKLISNEISKPLDPRDLKHGYVYSYEVEGNEGYVKIGYTTRPLWQRHKEWSFDCNRQTKPLYPSAQVATATMLSVEEVTTTPAMLVPHARRVEALCHAELDHRRIRIYCTACLKQHIEWFEVSAMEAALVIQKWSRWMATQPYELLQLRVNPKWTLKAGEVRRISRLDQFMGEIAKAPAPL